MALTVVPMNFARNMSQKEPVGISEEEEAAVEAAAEGVEPLKTVERD